jgi:archaellum biogenesis ATPase FlaH
MKFKTATAAAQFYNFEYGWSCMPIGRLTDRGEPKAPFLGAGEIIPLRTNALDGESIAAIWSMYPTAGVAVLTGKLSNVSVIDVDFENKVNGLPVAGSPLAYHGDIPTNTLMARSGSGGLHFFFKHSPKADGRKELRPHIDLKSEGGYIILPPSKHKSGREYEWLNDLPLADFPEHLLENRQPVQASSGVSPRSFWDKLVKGLAEGEGGGRNNYIASVAGMCFKNDIPVEDAILYLIPFGQSCKPAVDIDTIERTVRSTYKTALSKQPAVKDESTIEVVDLWQAADEVSAEVGNKRYSLGLYGSPQRPLNDPQSVFTVEPDPISDSLGGGMVLGDLGVISGHTGRGKTLLAQVITQSLIVQGEKSLWFEFELMPPEMRERFMTLGVDKGMVFIPRDKETKNLDGSMEFVEAAILKAKKDHGIKFVFLDLLDRFRPRNDKEKKAVNTNLSSYLGLIAEQLKDLAVKHRVVIILMAHTRKPPAGLTKQAPDLHDINNSGGVAQNADWVLMVHRKSLKEIGTASDDADALSDITRITLHKNRRTGKYANIEISFKEGTISRASFVPLLPGQKEASTVEAQVNAAFDDL